MSAADSVNRIDGFQAIPSSRTRRGPSSAPSTLAVNSAVVSRPSRTAAASAGAESSGLTGTHGAQAQPVDSCREQVDDGTNRRRATPLRPVRCPSDTSPSARRPANEL